MKSESREGASGTPVPSAGRPSAHVGTIFARSDCSTFPRPHALAPFSRLRLRRRRVRPVSGAHADSGGPRGVEPVSGRLPSGHSGLRRLAPACRDRHRRARRGGARLVPVGGRGRAGDGSGPHRESRERRVLVVRDDAGRGRGASGAGGRVRAGRPDDRGVLDRCRLLRAQTPGRRRPRARFYDGGSRVRVRGGAGAPVEAARRASDPYGARRGAQGGGGPGVPRAVSLHAGGRAGGSGHRADRAAVDRVCEPGLRQQRGQPPGRVRGPVQAGSSRDGRSRNGPAPAARRRGRVRGRRPRGAPAGGGGHRDAVPDRRRHQHVGHRVRVRADGGERVRRVRGRRDGHQPGLCPRGRAHPRRRARRCQRGRLRRL